MNLAFITKRYGTVGGTERDLFELTRRLASAGHQVRIFCRDIEQVPVDGVVVNRVAVRGINRASILQSLASEGPALAYEGQPDLVVSYARVLRQDVIRCGGGTHAAFLKGMRETDSVMKRVGRRLDPYHRAMLRIEREQYAPGNYRKVIAISRVVERELLDTFDIPGDRIEVIYDGIDLDTFKPAPDQEMRRRIRTEYRIPADAPVVLFLGNAFQRKGLDVVLSAMTRLVRNGVYALIVGTDPKLAIYQAKSAKLQVDTHVRFVGAQRQPQRYYSAADVLVLPSLHEAFGNVVLEAMACGLPAVVSSRAGASEVLADGLERFILGEPADDSSLADLIVRLLEENQRGGWSRVARKIAERYGLDAHVGNCERCFKSLVDG